MKQVWFPGVHCDVGGGYAEAESGLSKLALESLERHHKTCGMARQLFSPAQFPTSGPGCMTLLGSDSEGTLSTISPAMRCG